MWQKFLMKRMIDKSFVRWSENRCLRNRNKQSQCSLCEEICPQPALVIEDGKLTFDHSTCSNCRLCIHVCPTEAFNYEFEQLHKYEQKIQSYESVCFSCGEQGDSNTDVILPCVSSLTPEMLMIADLHDKKVQILWDEKHCRSCKSNWTHERDFSWVREWNKSEASNNKVEIINKKGEKLAAKRKITRRELFSFTKNKTKEQLATLVFDSFDHAPNFKNKLPLTERRKYLLAYLKKNSELGIVPKKVAKKIGVVNISVTSNCKICQKCSATCPTGALTIVETEDTKSLTFQPQQCIDCDICEHACLEISKHPIKFEEITLKKVLLEQKLTNCPSCGEKKLEFENYCEECTVKHARKNILQQNW
jgi:NAD-dependent dihydropyrimidine dehydrogenase PreA subunit